MDEWAPQIDAYLKQSPFDTNTTEAIKKETSDSLSKIDYLVQSRDETLHWEQYRGNVDGWAAGMPAPVQGFLGYLLQVEGGGRYDSMYSPDGAPRTFTDMKDHPNQAAVISSGPNAGKTSSAAGGFQFLKSTWDEAKAALNLPDFSPASQQRAAWWLAQRDYKARTGMDLLPALASGDPAMLSGVMRALAPTWEALGVGDRSKEFIAAVTGGTAIAPEALNDPRYANVPFTDRLSMLTAAQSQTTKALADMAKMQLDTTNSLVTQFKSEVSAGLHNDADILAFGRQNNLSEADIFGLINEKDKTLSDQAAMQRLMTAVTTPGAVFGDAEKKGLNALYEQKGRAAVQSGDQEYMNNTLLPIIAKTHMMPTGLAEDMKGALASKNPNTVAFALQNLSVIRGQTGGSFSQALSGDAESAVVKFNLLSSAMPPLEAAQEVMTSLSPEGRALLGDVAQRSQQYRASKASSFTADSIAIDLTGTGATGMDSLQRDGMMMEFNALFETEMRHYSDPGQARTAALELMKNTWGATDLGTGESYTIKYPPQQAGLPRVGNSYDWIDRGVRQAAGALLPPDAKYRLFSDPQTNRSMAGDKVSYGLDIQLSTGQWLPMLDEQGEPFRVDVPKAGPGTGAVDSALASRKLTLLGEANARMKMLRETLYGSKLDFPGAADYNNAIGLLNYLASTVSTQGEPLSGYDAWFNDKAAGPMTKQPEELLRAMGFTTPEQAINAFTGANMDDLMKKLIDVGAQK